MNSDALAMKLNEIMEDGRVLVNEPMRAHTSFRVGGPADILIRPSSAKELRACLEIFQETDTAWQVIGNGSNLLVSDEGIEGAVIEIADSFSQVCVDGTHINAQSGALLSVVASSALEANLTGFEFAGGIPGTLGGAVVMNAGAYGGEMKDVIESVMVMTTEGEILNLNSEELDLSYRHSCIPEKGYIVLGVRLRLSPGDPQTIRDITRDLTQKRTSKQPLHLPSAGSTFKRPPGYFAGQLIEEAGLKGVRYGDAQVSDKHCGFVVNMGNASCHEVISLIRLVQRVVRNRHGVILETEVKVIGRPDNAEAHC